MSTVATWVGFVVCILAAIGVAAAGVGIAYDRIMEWRRLARYRVEELARRRFAGTLMEASWWFSEDRSAMRAMQLMLEPALNSDGVSPNVGDIRDKWRREKATFCPPAAKEA